MPNSQRRTRCDKTVLSRRVGRREFGITVRRRVVFAANITTNTTQTNAVFLLLTAVGPL